jgi:flagellar basal body-associated protein FliL
MDRRALLGLAAVAVSAAPARASDPKGAPQASYMRLPTITTNVRRPGGSRGVMTVEIGLDTPDAGLRTRVAQSTPRLRAAYATVVQQSASALLPGAPPDLERMIAQLQSATNATLGRAGARLLIGTVMVV